MSMDCRTVQELLDVSRESRQDWDEPELREAARHVETCDSCCEVLAARDQFDRQLRRAMSQVAVPSGLLERLVEQCQVELKPHGESTPAERIAVDLPTPAVSINPHKSSRSRRLRWVSLGIAASLLCTVGVWSWLQPSTSTLSMEQATLTLANRLMSDPARAIPRDMSSLAAFDNSFDAQVHDLLWTDAVSSDVRGLDLDDRPGQEGAVYQFQLRGGRLAGLLVVIPRSALADPPGDDAPTRGNVRYNPVQQVAWTRGEQVYVCLMTRGSIDDLISEMHRLS